LRIQVHSAEDSVLEATCIAKLATWACTAAAATLRARDLELYALLADR